MVAPQGFGYLGQALSAAEQYAAVYGAAYRPGTDRVVCSPGHYVIAAYAGAAETGLLDEAALASYGQNGSSLEAIGTERSPVPEHTRGSAGAPRPQVLICRTSPRHGLAILPPDADGHFIKLPAALAGAAAADLRAELGRLAGHD